MDKLQYFYQKTVELLPQLAIGLLVLLITFVIAVLIRKLITKRIKPKTKNPLLADFIGKVIALAINIIGLVLFLEIVGLGDIAAHLLAGAGILTFVIGFAFKDIGENFLSGIILAFKSPFGINDLIESVNVSGYVTEFNLRQTVIKTTDGKDVFIPNSQILKNPLINYTVDGYLRYDFVVGLDYENDPDKAIELIEQCLKTIPEIVRDKKPLVIIEELAASTINIRIYYWINTFSSKSKSYHNKIRSKVISIVLKELGKQAYYLPSDIIELKNYKNNLLNTKHHD